MDIDYFSKMAPEERFETVLDYYFSYIIGFSELDDNEDLGKDIPTIGNDIEVAVKNLNVKEETTKQRLLEKTGGDYDDALFAFFEEIGTDIKAMLIKSINDVNNSVEALYEQGLQEDILIQKLCKTMPHIRRTAKFLNILPEGTQSTNADVIQFVPPKPGGD